MSSAGNRPKSTDVEDFDLRWLHAILGAFSADQRPQDVQATLCRLAATTIANALISHLEGVSEIYVCGAGARNRALMPGSHAEPLTISREIYLQ